MKHNFYKNSFFPSAIIKWNNPDSNLWNSESFGTFENNILIFIRLKPTSCLNCCNLKGIRLITRLRFGLSHEHKFKYNFQNCLNLLCSCGLSIESTSHFLLHCPIFNNKWHTLLRTLNNIDCKILESTPPRLKLTLSWWGGFPPRSFYPSALTRRAQMSVTPKVVRPTDLLNNVKSWVNTD